MGLTIKLQKCSICDKILMFGNEQTCTHEGIKMKAEYIKTLGTWRDVADDANETIGREPGTKEPPSTWKKRILLSEHSPIRSISFKIRIKNLLSWVSVHLVRHWLGITHFVKTQRTDRTGNDRNQLKQSEMVNHRITVNAQALINISRKRLCSDASIDTREAWQAVLNTLKDKEPEIYECCVPECIYRGFCVSFTPCGYSNTEQFKTRLNNYRKIGK